MVHCQHASDTGERHSSQETAEPRTSRSVWAVGPKLLVFWFGVLIYERLCGLCALSSLGLVKLGNAGTYGPWALGRYGLS